MRDVSSPEELTGSGPLVVLPSSGRFRLLRLLAFARVLNRSLAGSLVGGVSIAMRRFWRFVNKPASILPTNASFNRCQGCGHLRQFVT